MPAMPTFFDIVRLFRRSLWAAIVFFVLSLSPVFADDVYPYRVEPSTIEALKKGPNAQVYVYRQVIAMMKSEVPVSQANASSATSRVLVYGKYNSPRGMVDLEIRGDIRAGMLEIDFPIGRVDAVLFEWEENAASPDELKALKPRVRNLTFRETQGFRAVYLIERNLPYQLTVDIPYNPLTKNLMPPRPAFSQVAEFVKMIESREHGRAILEGNSTGLPSFITLDQEKNALVAGYLLNAVRWYTKDDRWEYVYDEDLKDIRHFPEVKTLLKSPGVKAFVETGGETRVKAFGGEKTGFSFTLLKDGGGRRLEATLIGRRVEIKPAPVPAGFPLKS
jgi:hypothetical protein